MDVSTGAQKGQKRNSNSASIITEESLGCHKLQGYHGYYDLLYASFPGHVNQTHKNIRLVSPSSRSHQ